MFKRFTMLLAVVLMGSLLPVAGQEDLTDELFPSFEAQARTFCEDGTAMTLRAENLNQDEALYRFYVDLEGIVLEDEAENAARAGVERFRWYINGDIYATTYQPRVAHRFREWPANVSVEVTGNLDCPRLVLLGIGSIFSAVYEGEFGSGTDNLINPAAEPYEPECSKIFEDIDGEQEMAVDVTVGGSQNPYTFKVELMDVPSEKPREELYFFIFIVAENESTERQSIYFSRDFTRSVDTEYQYSIGVGWDRNNDGAPGRSEIFCAKTVSIQSPVFP